MKKSSEANLVETLNVKRKAELFDHFCSVLVLNMRPWQVIEFIDGGGSWGEWVDDWDSYVNGGELINDLLEPLTDEEHHLVLKKNLGELIKETLKAKQVSIEW